VATVYRYAPSAFPFGAANEVRLATEIVAEGVPAPINLLLDDASGDYLVVFEEALSDVQKNALDETISVHEDDPHHLPTVKAAKFGEIDAKTTSLIENGFEYNGQRFSLAGTSQIKLIGMDLLRGDPLVSFPVKFNTIDDHGAVSLQDANAVHAFVLTAFGAYRTYLDTGTSLKDQVRAATTVEGVTTIIDPR
jgi:hypothetical protein